MKPPRLALLLLAPLLFPTPSPAAPARQALDVEKLRVVAAGWFPQDIPTCDVLVVGGGLGGVAAAEDLARQGVSVILTEPTGHLGGQLTAQGLGTPDENSYIERDPGPGTRHYRELRAQVRLGYALADGVLPARALNVGQCWVSRVSGTPGAWEAAILARLRPWAGPRGIRQVLLRHQLLGVHRYPGNGRFSYADFVDLDTRRVTRVGAHYLLDATETGDALALAGAPWTIGQEARRTYGEPDAPPVAHPEWVQSFTYDFVVRWAPGGPTPITLPPPEYPAFKAEGEYTLAYDYPLPRGPVEYRVFAKAPGTGGPFWTYRRQVAAASFEGPVPSPEGPGYADSSPSGAEDLPPEAVPSPGGASVRLARPFRAGTDGVPSPPKLGAGGRSDPNDGDISLINWRGNDYRDGNFIGLPPQAQVRVLRRAKDFARGFLYWLQAECPRDDGGLGYPEMQPAGDVLGGDGFAPFPYVRESRRLLAVSTLTENDLVADPTLPNNKTGTDFFDAVGLALYDIDIHPAAGEPPRLAAVLPYALPLGAFIARGGPDNVLPAALDFGASRLAAASARTHPTEWLAGEVAAHLAAFCLRHSVTPAQVRATPALLAAFQSQLEADGIPTRWREVEPSLAG